MTEEYENKAKGYSAHLAAGGYNPKTAKSKFDESAKVSWSVVRKKSCSITTTSVIFSVEFSQHDPNDSEIINKHWHLLETDNTLKQLFPTKSITVANNRRRKLQELITRADF